MAHADDAALQRLQPVLRQLRGIAGLREMKPGIFYLKGSAFLHFHEDGGALFADLKKGRRQRLRPLPGRRAARPAQAGRRREAPGCPARRRLMPAMTTADFRRCIVTPVPGAIDSLPGRPLPRELSP